MMEHLDYLNVRTVKGSMNGESLQKRKLKQLQDQKERPPNQNFSLAAELQEQHQG